MPCVSGSEDFTKIKELVKEVLSRNGLLKKVVEHDRIVVFKTGFLKSVKLVYYHSDGFFEICGDRDHVDLLITGLAEKGIIVNLFDLRQGLKQVPKREREDNIVDRVSELLIERNILCQKRRHCKLSIYSMLFMLFFIYSVLAYYKVHSPVAYLLTTFFIVFFTLIPYKPHLPRETRFTPILYWRYGRELEKIEEDIRFLKEFLPRDHPIYYIVEKNLREKC